MTAILPMNAPARRELSIWTSGAALALIGHLALVFGFSLYDPSSALQGDAQAPPIIIDLAPLTVAPAVQPQEVAPGPELPPPPSAAEQPKPEENKPEQTKVEAPPADDAPVVLPQPAPGVEPGDKLKSLPPQPATATPRAKHVAPVTAAARIGNSAAATAPPQWVSRLLAHLNRNKRYPAEARLHHEEGVVTLGFTVDRNGHVLAHHIDKSSGSSVLDEEAMAMLRRSEPLPAFLPTMAGASRSFSVPIRFSLR